MYRVINENQFGFQKGKSINKLLGAFCNLINTSLSNNMHCLVLFIDFSKAFDTLTHANLLLTLERIGIRGKTLIWFKNYLECRSYQVKIKNNYSSQMQTDCGVPQGSKLGPILYLIYANDMLNALSEKSTYAYADDTAVVVTDTNLTQATILMQKQLDTITRWCHDNSLIINATKTKIMYIKPRHFTHKSINIIYHNYDCLHAKAMNLLPTNDTCDTIIELVDNYKYLGVYVDSTFKWKFHIENLQKKLRKSAHMLRHLTYCSTYNVTRQAYFSLAESYLRHGIAAWGSSTHVRALQKTQDQILKILLKQTSNNYTQNNQTNILMANNTQNNNLLNNTNNTNNNNISISNNEIYTHPNISVTNTDNSVSFAGPNNNTQINKQTNKILSNTNNKQNTSITKTLNVLSVKNIYNLTLVNEYYKDYRYLKVIDHCYNTRRRKQGRYKVGQFFNEYGRHALNVALPTIFNKIPLNILNLSNVFKRKKELKKYFISLQ